MQGGLIHRRSRGITLIELLGGMAIVAILAALLFPSLTKAKRMANQAKSVANLRTLGHASLQFAVDHNNQLPCYQEPASSYTPNPTYRLWWFQYLVRDYCDGNYAVIHDPNDDFKTSTGAPRFTTMNTTTGVADLTYSYAMNTNIPAQAPGTMNATQKNARMCRQVWLEHPAQTALLIDTCESGALGPTTDSSFRYSVNGTASNVLFCDGSVGSVPRQILLRSEASKNADTLRQNRLLWFGDQDATAQIQH